MEDKRLESKWNFLDMRNNLKGDTNMVRESKHFSD